MNMDVRPLLNDSDLDWALAEIEAYFDHQPELGSPEAARYDVLAALIENYEDKRWATDPFSSVRPDRMARPYKVSRKQGFDLLEMSRRRVG